MSALIACAAIGAACSGGAPHDDAAPTPTTTGPAGGASASGGGTVQRPSGPGSVPARDRLIAEWQVSRATMVAIIRVEELLPPQWNIEPAPASAADVPDDGVIFRDARVVVEDVLLGSGAGPELYVRVLGGEVDGVRVEVAGEAAPVAGQRYLAFLEEGRDPRVRSEANAHGVVFHMVVLGGADGLWAVSEDTPPTRLRDQFCETAARVRSFGQLRCEEYALLLEEIAGAADLIAIGTAGPTSDDRCVAREGGVQPVKETEFFDVEVLRGRAPSRLVVSTPRSRCDGVFQVHEGIPAVAEGTRYLLFLDQPPAGDVELADVVWKLHAVWEVMERLDPPLVTNYRGGSLLLDDVRQRVRALGAPLGE